MTLEIGGRLLTAFLVAGIVALVIEWWRFRARGR
jgi:hypothetical protein